MLSPSQSLDEVRPLAVDLVRYEEARLGSRMNAYQAIASRIGVSASWLRKFVGNQPVGLKDFTARNLDLAHRRAFKRAGASRGQNDTPAELARRLRDRLDDLDRTRNEIAELLASLDLDGDPDGSDIRR